MVFHCTSPFCLLVTCTVEAIPSAQHPGVLHSACCVAASRGVLCTAFLHPSVLQLVLVWAGICHRWAFIHAGCLPGEGLALIHASSWVLSAFPEGTFCPVCQAADEEAKQYWFQCWPWEMLLIAGLPVKLQVVELSLNLTMTWSQFSNPFLKEFFL